jgi:hypothetical protein
MWTLISHCATVDDVCPVTCGPTFASFVGDITCGGGIDSGCCAAMSGFVDSVGRFCVQLDTIHFLLRMVRIREMLYSHWISATVKKVWEDQQGLYLNETHQFIV